MVVNQLEPHHLASGLLSVKPRVIELDGGYSGHVVYHAFAGYEVEYVPQPAHYFAHSDVTPPEGSVVEVCTIENHQPLPTASAIPGAFWMHLDFNVEMDSINMVVRYECVCCGRKWVLPVEGAAPKLFLTKTSE